MIDVEWDNHHDEHVRRRYPYRHKASTIHGWVTKLRGTLTGNEHVRSAGIREMKDARTIRRHRSKREAEHRERERRRSGGGFFSSLFSGSRRHDSSREVIVVHRDGSRSHQHSGKGPFLHFPRRARPLYHGHGTRFWGAITNNRHMSSKGRHMNRSAAKERARERRRRQKQKQREGHELRVDARRSTRRRR